jgi:TctA family transporter
MLEEHFITSMIKADGRFLGFFERPIAAALGIATILLWLWPLLRRLRSRRGAALG